MKISVPIRPDPNGFTGRECPGCERYFKIKGGTGLSGDVGCHCPYCNHHGPQSEFWTKKQIEYAKSVAMNQVSANLLRGLKGLERKPARNAFISIGIKVSGSPTPIKHYAEKDLEQLVTCESCTLEYAIYGAFGFCPDCGVHNSKQILGANLDLALKIADLADSESEQIRNRLVENSLEDAIAAFDGFGREHCIALPAISSFQNISIAAAKLLSDHGVDLTKGLASDEWAFVREQFQKRHLLAHRLSVIDAEYIKKTGCPPDMLGRKVSITKDDVVRLVRLLRIMGENLYGGVLRS